MRLFERQKRPEAGLGPLSGPPVRARACLIAAVATVAGTAGGSAQLQLPGTAPAAEESASEEVIPRAHPVDRYLSIWQKSPFQREVAEVAAPMQKSFARDYAVGGYIGFGEKPVVTLINKKTRSTLRITNEEKDGFQVIEVVEGASPRDLTVKVSKDGEIADLTFDESLLNTPASVPQGRPNRQQQLRQPGMQNPGAQRGSITRPGAPPTVTPADAASAAGSAGANGRNAQLPSKPPPPPQPVQSSGDLEEDLAPSPESRRRVVLPTARQ